MITMNKTSSKNQHIFLSSGKDLEVGGWGLENPYGVRILNSLKIVGRSLIILTNRIFHSMQGSSLEVWSWCVAWSCQPGLLHKDHWFQFYPFQSDLEHILLKNISV